MSMNSVIKYRANSHFIKIQEDYLALCDSNDCQVVHALIEKKPDEFFPHLDVFKEEVT